MAARIDVDELKSRISMVELAGACGVELKKQGNEYKGLCPFHSEKTPSFTVTPNKSDGYYCFGCGEGGDHVAFISKLYGTDFQDSLEKLQEIAGTGIATGEARPKRAPKEPEPETWQPLGAGPEQDAPATLAVNRDGKWVDLPVVAAWAYRDLAGGLHGYTCRIEPEPGKKEIIPLTWMTNTETGSTELRRKSLPEPRLLYGAEYLQSNPKANVILVEGEKAADAARRLLTGKPFIVLSWPGGGKAVSKADWQLLANRKIVGWPDCDSKRDMQTGEYKPHHEQPGTSAMLDIAARVSEHGATMRIVNVPQPGELEDGWDAADAEAEGWDATRVVKYLKDNAAKPVDLVPSDDQPPADDQPNEPEPEPSQPCMPFRCLGVDEGNYYYLPSSTQQVTPISAAGHSNKSNLLQLAPLEWWESTFGAKNGPDWTAGASYLFELNAAIGTFDATKVRGRGAWFDDGRSVLHLGDRLLVDGKQIPITDFQTRFIYERKPPLEGLMPEGHLDESEALRLHQITGMLNWQKPINSTLLAGWIVLSPICGAMQWRPHVWLTGQRGTGKTWLVDNIIAPAIGASSLTVQSNSTEAGIRQRLKQDARPVVFDEAEGENQHARQRMQAVLELARQASSDGLAEIAKGTAGGKALSFKVRSMFLMGSINVGLAQASDKSRFTVLTLSKAPHGIEGRKQFEALEETVNNTMTKEFCAGLRARTYHLIPTIRKSAKVFAKAAAEHIGNQRAGDQLGALLAGAWSLGSSEVVTEAEAADYVRGQDWGLDADESMDSDETMLMQHLLSSRIDIEIQGGFRRTRTVAEILEKLSSAHMDQPSNDFEYMPEDGKQAIARAGIRYADGFVIISESHPRLKEILRDTPWGGGWGDIISRISGAERLTAYRFAGMRTRAIKIPIEQIIQ